MTINPEISIIVPTYCRPALLAKALRSVRAQSYQNYECIVVNDCPEGWDDVCKVVRDVGDARFRSTSNPCHVGACASRNAGVYGSSGRIIAFLDDDDWWHPQKLEKHYAKHCAGSPGSLVYSSIIRVWDRDVIRPWPLDAVSIEGDAEAALWSGRLFPFTTSAFTVDRESFRNVGGFDDHLVGAQDWDLWVRLAKQNKFICIEEQLCYFLQHAGARLSTSMNLRYEALQQLEQKYGGRQEFPELKRRIIMHIELGAMERSALKRDIKGMISAVRALFKEFRVGLWLMSILPMCVLLLSKSMYDGYRHLRHQSY